MVNPSQAEHEAAVMSGVSVVPPPPRQKKRTSSFGKSSSSSRLLRSASKEHAAASTASSSKEQPETNQGINGDTLLKYVCYNVRMSCYSYTKLWAISTSQSNTDLCCYCSRWLATPSKWMHILAPPAAPDDPSLPVLSLIRLLFYLNTHWTDLYQVSCVGGANSVHCKLTNHRA